MLIPKDLRTIDRPRIWSRIWRDPPGFFGPGWRKCNCCTTQAYHTLGGENNTPVVLSTNYQWSGGWTTKAALAVTREAMGGATPTVPNPAYIYGGASATSPFWLQRCDNYVPDTWSTDTATSVAARDEVASCAISSLCYSWGGKNVSNVVQSTNEQLTPGSPSTWATKTAVTVALWASAASYIGAKGYNTGGVTAASATVRTNYEYDPSGNSWATKTQMPTPARSGHAAFTISGTMYCIDGGATILPQNDSYVVDTWTAKIAPLGSIVRQYLGNASIDAGGVGWITGGLPSSGVRIATHDEYVPDTWTNRTNAPQALDRNRSVPA